MADLDKRRSRRPVSGKTVHRKKVPTGELANTLTHVEKRYGVGSVKRASDIHQPSRISTGSFILDFCLLGGIPDNRISMVVGERHSGKSSIANKIIASAQKKYPDKLAVFVDVEGTYEATWGKALGVDTDALQVVPCETGEMAVDIADAVVRSREASLVVVDSLAALVPMKEIEGSAEDAHVGLQSRLIGGMVRKLTAGLIAERKRGHFVTVLFINQFRMKIGVSFGDPRSIPGGKALEFATSIQWIMKNKEKKGKNEYDVESIEVNEHAFTITKNKLNGGPRTGEFMLRRLSDETTGLGIGDIDDGKTMLAYAKKFGAYSGGGSSWTLDFDGYDQTFKSVGDAIVFLYNNRPVYHALSNWLIREQARSLGMPDNFLDTFVCDPDLLEV